jgi:molecular chaperone HtpG
MTEPHIHTTRVDLGGLMTVLGNNLYSTPLVAVRELVQNAHDACVRRRIETGDAGEGSIRVLTERTPPTLIVEDTGAGLTQDEIVRYLATVGTGMTRQLRANGAANDSDAHENELIGMFGLGFLSAFVVGEKVIVTTTSHTDPSLGHRYQSVTGETYTLESCAPRPVGTRVEIRLKKAFEHLADIAALRLVLEKYCALLTIPVQVGESDVAINAVPPPWRSEADNPVRARKERFAFAERMERRFAPLAAMALDAPEDGSTDVRGVLWLQDSGTYGTSDNRALTVYVRGMMLDDDGRDLLPAWAGFVSGAIESRRLVPTASREDLQRDETFHATQVHVERALVSGLAQLSKDEPETWRRVLMRHNEALLGAALASQALFDLLADDLTLPTSEGDLPIRTLLKRGNGTVYVSLSERGGFEEMLFRALQTPVAIGTRYAVLPFAGRYTELRKGRLVRLGTEGGNQALFKRETALPPVQLAALEALLGAPGRELVPARFAPKSLPFVLVPDRDAELKARIEGDEAAKRISSAALGLARLFTAKVKADIQTRLFVNLDAAPIARLLAREMPLAPNAPAALLLRSLVALLAGSGGEYSDGDQLSSALASYTDAVDQLLASDATATTSGGNKS